MGQSALCVAPINIALVKYWGKADENQNIPLNPSISLTLSCDDIFTSTKVSISPGDGKIVFILDGAKKEVGERMLKVINTFGVAGYDITVESSNSFPTSAGMASSASGMAALVLCLDQVFETNLTQGRLSEIARLGSGSACRSIFGGCTMWDGLYAVQLFDHHHWPELRCIVLIVDQSTKKVPSTRGMRLAAKTSALLKERLAQNPSDINNMLEAIKAKDFERFAYLTMKESNQLHAICLDTFPPIHYLNDKSFAIIDKIHALNETECKAAYSFDAGPNAFIFTLNEHLEMVKNEFSDHKQVVCSIGSGPYFI